MTFRHLTLVELLRSGSDHGCGGVGADHVCVKIVAVADLPSRFGDFRIVASRNDRDEKDHVAIVRGDPVDGQDVPVRIHSQCRTGDALGSLRCDITGHERLPEQADRPIVAGMADEAIATFAGMS